MRENLERRALYGIRNAPAAARAMVERLGLGGREEQLAGELSGGWQRLALAPTLPNPQLLLLDEPTAGVDPKARHRVLERDSRARPAGSRCWFRPTTWTKPALPQIAYIALGVLLVQHRR